KSSKALADWYRQTAKNWSVLVSPSAYFTEKMTSAFSLDELKPGPMVVEVGAPRNVALAAATTATTKQLRDALGLPEGKKVALYAPTFRENQHSAKVGGHTYALGLDFAELERELADEWVILFRAH